MNDKKSNSSVPPNIRKWLNTFPILSESDFYPPVDNRTLHSGVQDIYNGDCFDNYIKEFNKLYDEEFY